MGALAPELQLSYYCQGQVNSTRDFGKSGNDSSCSAMRFNSRSRGLRSTLEASHLLSSSSSGRWLPLTQCGEWRVRDLNGERGQRGIRRGRVGTRRSMAVHVVAVGRVGASKPSFVPLEQITGEAHFDQILSEAVERNQPVVVDWVAQWCRKCIYLKPKLEKIAAEFHPHVKFYYVDVNSVPSALVKRAEVTKMPTIQLWKNGQRLAEVIGGHQAWLVVDEVREMIKLQK